MLLFARLTLLDRPRFVINRVPIETISNWKPQQQSQQKKAQRKQNKKKRIKERLHADTFYANFVVVVAIFIRFKFPLVWKHTGAHTHSHTHVDRKKQIPWIQRLSRIDDDGDDDTTVYCLLPHTMFKLYVLIMLCALD